MTVGPVLAVDVGTSSVRVAVVTPDAEVLDDVRVAQTGDPGRSFDAEALWTCIARSVAALSPSARSAVTVVSVAAHLGSVLLDGGLRVTAPASGWSDRSGVAEVARALGDDRVGLLRRTGRPVTSAGPLAAFVAARRVPGGSGAVLAVSPKDFVVARLTASVAADVSTDPASAAYTGALDVGAVDWSPTVLDRTGVDPTALGRLVRSDDTAGLLRDDVARATGLPPGVPVVAGGPDGTVGLTYLLAGTAPTDAGTAPTDAGPAPAGTAPTAAASPATAIGDVAGTTDVVAVRRASHADAPAGAVVNPFPLGGWTVGGPTGTTGGAVALWSRLLGHRDTAAAMAALGPAIADLPLGVDGLRVGVELSGSRFPAWDDGVTGGVTGLTDEHGPAHLLRAVVEGGARVVADAVAALPVDPDAPVLLAGGAARSRLVAGIRAAVLGRQVTACDEPDVTLMGAALLGAIGSATDGERDDLLDHFAPCGTVVDPPIGQADRVRSA